MRSVQPLPIAVLLLSVGVPASAHVTPNVQLVKRSVFVRDHLPAASSLFEKELALGDDAVAEIRHRTGWTPTAEEVKVYVARDVQERPVGSVVFLWTASQHGPVGVGVVFDPAGAIVAATVTDVASEPLSWIRPLLVDGLRSLVGLALGSAPDASAIAPGVTASMPRYYATVIAKGVARAQAVQALVFGQ